MPPLFERAVLAADHEHAGEDEGAEDDGEGDGDQQAHGDRLSASPPCDAAVVDAVSGADRVEPTWRKAVVSWPRSPPSRWPRASASGSSTGRRRRSRCRPRSTPAAASRRSPRRELARDAAAVADAGLSPRPPRRRAGSPSAPSISTTGRWTARSASSSSRRLRLDGRPESVLVQRGWVGAQLRPSGRCCRPWSRLPGRVDVAGRVAATPSRLLELEAAASGPIRQNVDVASFARETGLELLPLAVIEDATTFASDRRPRATLAAARDRRAEALRLRLPVVRHRRGDRRSSMSGSESSAPASAAASPEAPALLSFAVHSLPVAGGGERATPSARAAAAGRCSRAAGLRRAGDRVVPRLLRRRPSGGAHATTAS